jgi:hypothetical protein
LNGLTKFPEDVTVEVGIYGLFLRLECGEECAFVIPEDLEDGVTLNFFRQATQDVSTALTHALSRAGNGEPKTHHL